MSDPFSAPPDGGAVRDPSPRPWEREVLAVGAWLAVAGTLTGAAMFALLRAATFMTELEELELFDGEPISPLHRWSHHLTTLILAVAAGGAWWAFARLRRRRGTPNEALTPWGAMGVIGAVVLGYVLAVVVAKVFPQLPVE
jgi:uncharacterized BrkB/YihY/UPF0761 family membrane protein